MAVEIDLQTERAPCGDANVGETEYGIYEVEIIVKTFAGIIFEKSFMGVFVVPWFV